MAFRVLLTNEFMRLVSPGNRTGVDLLVNAGLMTPEKASALGDHDAARFDDQAALEKAGLELGYCQRKVSGEYVDVGRPVIRVLQPNI